MDKGYRPGVVELALPAPYDKLEGEAGLQVEAAVDWVLNNTTFRFEEGQGQPATVKLFILKYCELAGRAQGVQSESIAGMSQSFESREVEEAVRDLAAAYLSPWFRNACFVQFAGRWGR